MKISRRNFLAYSGGSVLTLYMTNRFGLPEALAKSIPGGTLDPATVPKYLSRLVIPPAMPPSGTHTYDIAVRQFTQQVLPPPLPATTVWGYGSTTNASTFNSPAFTIEASRGTPVTVTWRNELVDGSGHFLPHLLPVDPTLHWAHPPGGEMGRDMRPAFASTPGPYTGPVPIVTHVHGMQRVADWSDGYPEAWYLPVADDIPDDYATVGTWYDFFDRKANGGVAAWAQGTATFTYPNSQRASTAWYHDHTLGMTRLNVYAGPAGFYIVRGAASEEPTDALTGLPARLPGPAPTAGSDPFDTELREMPIAIQDRAFNADGSLFYPEGREFFDGFDGPFVPTSDVSPLWNPEFFGNCMVVNGRTWPYLEVAPQRYRFRLLNGCQSRFLILKFDDPKVECWQIGAEGGYLRAPVKVRELLMAPAERADVIVDFAGVRPGRNVTLLNLAPDAPFGGAGFRPADPQTTGQVMQFRVTLPVPAGFVDPTTPPARLSMPDIAAPVEATTTRHVALLESMSASRDVPAIPVEAHLGTFDPGVGAPSGITFLAWEDPVTENPAPGTVETWAIHNFTEDAHPIHIHEVFFQVIGRQRLDKRTGLPIQASIPPLPTEDGFKDTVIAYPGEVTRVQMTFGPGGQFVWHCHILEHEDNEMMRPYRVGPMQPGQPE